MSDSNGTAVPTVTIDPTPTSASSTPAPKPAATSNEEPHWLPERLERERRAMLRDMGVENVADVKAALADLKAKRDADKTAAEKAADAIQRATAAESSTSALKAAVSEFAARQMVGLTADQKAAVTAIAGDDAALQLKAIAALMPTWATVAPAAPTASAASTDTAPAPNAPAPTTTSETNHRAQYEALRKSNPFAAAAYGVAHASSVFGDGA